MAHRTDAGQRFPAEAQSVDAVQVLFAEQLAGRVRCDGERQLLRRDAPPVIGDRNQLAPSIGNDKVMTGLGLVVLLIIFYSVYKLWNKGGGGPG